MKIVVVGCTHAGTAAVVNLKELHPESEITIYEKNDNIEGFGYKKDPRIEEIKQGRDKRKDYAFWKKFGSSWCLEIREFLVKDFELEGFTKEVVEDYYGTDTEIIFKMK